MCTIQRDSFMTHLWAWRDSCLFDMCRDVCRDSFMCDEMSSCHIWSSHVTYELVMSHTNESCHIWIRHVTYEWVMWMSHVNESCHTYRSCDEVSSWEWDVTRACDMCCATHLFEWHDSFICVTRLTHMCNTTHSYVWHDLFICVMTWPIHMWHALLIFVMSYINLLHMWHDSFISDMAHSYETWPIHMWKAFLVFVINYSCVTWIIHMRHDSIICNMTHPCVTWLRVGPCRDIPQSIIHFPHWKCHRCDIWCDIRDILWNLTITTQNVSRSIILGQILGLPVNVPRGT